MENIVSTEKNIVSLALADIQPSTYNPRKRFDEAALAELAASIRRQGVLQPIGVRPVADTGRFEIIFGERRYRASLMAEQAEIPAIVLDVSDEEAQEMAVTENLQREDVSPMEEANAYQKLIENGRHDVPSLAVQFGKSENYIRTRLKFLSLIPEIAELLEADELTVGVAGEICRYGEDIQRDVYDNHLKEGVYGYNSWRGLKASDVAKNIERQYTTDLDRYRFDKTLCMSCPHNTNNMTLFCEGGCGNCTNRSCLDETNASYLAEKAVQLMGIYPATLCHREYCYNETVVERLASMGYEVETLKTYAEEYPEQPVAPEKEDYDTAEQYEQAYTEYERASADYTEECEMIRERVAAGEMAYYLRIDNDDITLCYLETADTAPEQRLSPMEKLEKQDERNREIALEKTVEDTKKRILEVDMADTKFGADEDRMIYFFLLSSLRREHFATVGIECGDAYHYLTDEEKMRIIDNLTAKEKALIAGIICLPISRVHSGRMPSLPSCSISRRNTCPRRSPTSRAGTTKSTRNVTSASRRRKPSCSRRKRRRRSRPGPRSHRRKRTDRLTRNPRRSPRNRYQGGTEKSVLLFLSFPITG